MSLPVTRPRLAVPALVLLAPVSAELSSGYLRSTGSPLELLRELTVFAPLYGGAVLLVREVVARIGGGWAARLLLALAFGVAMPTLVDLSLFTPVREDVDGWQQILAPTYVEALGTSLGPATAWAMGHVVLAVAAPLAVVEALTGRADVVRERWLGPVGLTLTAVLLAGAVVVVQVFQRTTLETTASATQLLVSGAVVLALLLAAVGWARTHPARTGTPARLGPVRATRLVLGGVVVTFACDAAATSWAFLVTCWVVLVLAAALLLGGASRRGWSVRASGMLAVGALASRAATAFANPPPDGVPLEAKLTQNAVYAGVVLLLLVAVAARRPAGSVPPCSPRPSSSTGAGPSPAGTTSTSTPRRSPWRTR